MNYISDFVYKFNQPVYWEKDILNDFIVELNSSSSTDMILKKLDIIFDFFKQYALKLENLGEMQVDKGASHSKMIYFERETLFGDLRFECMNFTGDCFTFLHTHPEFVVDEIIEGRLAEKIFEERENSLYFFLKTETRNEGDRRALYDQSGLPHKVCAIDGRCLSLCLTLGFQQVRKVTAGRLAAD